MQDAGVGRQGRRGCNHQDQAGSRWQKHSDCVGGGGGGRQWTSIVLLHLPEFSEGGWGGGGASVTLYVF